MQGAQLRPLNFGEILDVALNVVVKNLKTLLLAVAVVVVPVQLLAVLVQASTLPDSFDFAATPAEQSNQVTESGDAAAFLGGTAVTTVFGFIASAVATAACLKAISDAYLGEKPDWRESLRFAWKRLASVAWVTLLGGFLATLALIALIAPGVYLWVAWSVAIPALLLEDVRGRKALGRSFRLVKDRWWATFGILLIGFLIAAVISAPIQFILGFAGGLLGVVTGSPVVLFALSGIAGVLGAVLATPVQAAFVAILYFDLRVRKEGFDLELLAERIGASPGEAVRGSPYISPPASPYPPAPPPPAQPPPERPPTAPRPGE